MDNTTKVFWVVFAAYFFSKGVMSIPSLFNFGSDYITGLFHGAGICVILFAFYICFGICKKEKESKKQSEEKPET